MSKKVLPFNQAQNIWDNVIRDGKEIKLEVELEIHKKILNIIHIGEFYYWIVDLLITKFLFVSENIRKVLGYTPDEFTVEFFISIIHPDDLPYFVNFENKVVEFFNLLTADNIFNYKVSYDFRLRKKDGEYVRILHQVVTIQTTENGGVNKTLGLHTDISDIKSEGTPSLSIIGMDGEPSYLNIEVEEVFVPTKSLLSGREKEVLFHIIHGKQSTEIARILSVSKHTILNHRRNILTKTESSTTAELIAKTVQQGWL